MIVMIATRDGSEKVEGTSAGDVMLVNFLVPNSQLARIVLLEKKWVARGLQHARIVEAAHHLAVQPRLAPTVQRGSTMTKQETLVANVRQESIMLQKVKSSAPIVLRASIIRTQG